MIRVAVVDDFSIIRAGLKLILEAGSEFQVVAEAANGIEALPLANKITCDVMILDLEMSGGTTGIQTLQNIRRNDPDFPVLVLSCHSEVQYALKLLREGANGYVEKTASPDELLTAIRTVAVGSKYVSSFVAELLAEVRVDDTRAPHERLSPREMFVLKGLCEGRTLTSMGTELGISIKTVGTYRMRILEKLGVRSNADMLRYAAAQDLKFSPKEFGDKPSNIIRQLAGGD